MQRWQIVRYRIRYVCPYVNGTDVIKTLGELENFSNRNGRFISRRAIGTLNLGLTVFSIYPQYRYIWKLSCQTVYRKTVFKGVYRKNVY